MNVKLNQVKNLNYEEKIKNLKAANRDLEKKDQERTVKYNKLKTKI